MTTALATFGIASPAAAADDLVAYERTAYDGTIWEVTPEGAYALTWDEWSGRGFPAYTQAQTSYIRVSPFATVYAVTWFELPQSEWTDILTFPQFVQAGQPTPEVVPWADGIDVHKWQSSSELFATDPAGMVAKLTYSQWRDAGFPPFSTRANRGFITMTWDGSGAIAYMCDLAGGLGGKLTYDEWVSLGAPSPYKTGRVANDWLYSYPGPPALSRHLHYSGPVTVGYTSGTDQSRRLTFNEWQAMGAPGPDSRDGWSPSVPDPRCGAGSLSPLE